MPLRSSRRALLFLSLVAAVCGAQQLPAASKSDDKKTTVPRFASSTELVMVPAIVTNSAGDHLRGLKREDFQLVEDGVEQRVAVFEEVTTTNERVVPVLAATSKPEFTNRTPGGKAASSARRLTIIALDLINTLPEEQIYAREQLLQYIGDIAASRELFALYVISRNGNLRVVHNFTDDPQRLLQAAKRVQASARQLTEQPSMEALPSERLALESSFTVGSLTGELMEIMQQAEEADKNDTAFLNKLAATYTMQAIQQLANRYASVPGRKSLLWLTGGFPFTLSDQLGDYLNMRPTQLQPPGLTSFIGIAKAGRMALNDILPLYQRVWKDLANAQMAIYPVDVRGLTTVGTLPVSTWGTGASTYAHDASWENTERQGTMQAFAQETGGKAFYNTNDLRRAYSEAVKDSESYYMLGYYMNRARLKPGWHKVNVRVRGRGRVQVRARSGYFLTAAKDDSFSARLRDLNTAVLSPLDYTAVELTASWESVLEGSKPGMKRARFKLVMPPDFCTIDDADDNHFIMEVVAVARTPEGKVAAEPFSESLESNLQSASVQRLRGEGLTYRNSLELPPGEYSVRFVVRDGLSGRMGSVAAPLRVE